MNFASDNWAGAHPAVNHALAAASEGFAKAYGESDLDKEIEQKFSSIFETEVEVFFCATGTAANSFAISTMSKPGGVAFCYDHAHVIADECGAPEFFSGGTRLVPISGSNGKMDSQLLNARIGDFPAEFIHAGQPAGISLTQSTEIGTLYSLEEIANIAKIAKSHDLPLHMDGARFANAMVSLDVTPAEMTWKQGVDCLSFGATKNGAWCAEALVFFNRDLAKQMHFIRKRGAQLFSKSRFIAAQFQAYFNDDLWIKNATHANLMATKLANNLEKSTNAKLGWQPACNEVFAVFKNEHVKQLRAQGAFLHEWPNPNGSSLTIGDHENLFRMVTSFATTTESIDQFINILDSQ